MSDETLKMFAQIRAFEWDEDKREVNLRDHGIDFRDASGSLMVQFQSGDRIVATKFATWYSVSSMRRKPWWFAHSGARTVA